MEMNESVKVTLDLSKELTAAELESFRKQAEKEGHSLKDHLTILLFGKSARSEDAA
jgi:hypothetical protein